MFLQSSYMYMYLVDIPKPGLRLSMNQILFLVYYHAASLDVDYMTVNLIITSRETS